MGTKKELNKKNQVAEVASAKQERVSAVKSVGVGVAPTSKSAVVSNGFGKRMVIVLIAIISALLLAASSMAVFNGGIGGGIGRRRYRRWRRRTY